MDNFIWIDEDFMNNRTLHIERVENGFVVTVRLENHEQRWSATDTDARAPKKHVCTTLKEVTAILQQVFD